MKKHFSLPLLFATLFALSLFGQTPVTPVDARSPSQRVAPVGSHQPTVEPSASGTANGTDSGTGAAQTSPDYVLGPGDVLTMSEIDLEDVLAEKTFRVDNSGDVTLPLVGRLHVAGLTMVALEAEVNQRLAKFLKEPAVVIGVSEFHSQPVSVLGAVNNPGVHQLQGGNNLYTVLSLAGGLRPDAGSHIEITRNLKWGTIPLPDAKPDTTGQYSVASVNVKNVMAGMNPAENITVMPGDVISVPRADVVYAVGAVVKPGGFLVAESGALSALQVLSLAEGLDKTAAPKRAMILRSIAGSSVRNEIAVNLRDLMTGKGSDTVLEANDILFIPTSAAKAVSKRTIDAVVTAVTGMAVYGRL